MNLILKIILTLITIGLLLVPIIFNETIINDNMINETIVNENIVNETIVNETIVNETIVNETLIDVPLATFDYNYLLLQKGSLLNSYPPNSCEKIAKDYQREYGGQLVFVAPYNIKTGSWIMGNYAGHWINIILINNTQIYIDYNMGYTYIGKEDANTYMNYSMSNKFENENIAAKLFTYGEDSMPYSITWHY